MELRHEIRHGSLRDPRRALVPIFSAMGGMLLPVVIFSIFTFTQSESAGWGIPMSTDIAFALAVYALAGRGLPRQLRTFVMTVAVTDDSLTILMIALFFASSFNPLTMVSLAGVAAGLLLPGTRRLEKPVARVVAYAALPIFAFFSAGVNLTGVTAGSILGSSLGLGIVVAQLVGKPLGVLGTAWLVTKSKLGRLPEGVSWADLRSVGWLFAMCFTVSMLMIELAFPPEILQSVLYVAGANGPGVISTVSVLAATTIAGTIAAIAMRLRARKLGRA
jgi:NhaA family Na+:H+ antiporter